MMRNRISQWARRMLGAAAAVGAVALGAPAQATPFTMTVPATGVQLPSEYPQAGGVAIVMTGVNGNIYYQFSDPTGAFVGFQNNGQPVAFRGNPFTINDPIALDCGFRECVDYFGGAIARVDIRFSAYDGDTQVRGFDENDITLRMNGFDVGNWSGRQTDNTNDAGTVSYGLVTGFGNNTFNTGWFSSTNAALLADILDSGQTSTQVFDRDPNDNYWDFTRGGSLPRPDLRTIAPGYEFEKTLLGGDFDYAQVGETFTYQYIVRNIGSVDIEDITVVDDRIPNVTCPAPPNNSLPRTRQGQGQAAELVCEGTYRITQADIDAGEVTNIARANGTPEFGQLGEVRDTVTITGPVANNDVSLLKEGAPDPFGAVGSTVNYTFTVTNEGNTTLTNLVVSDPRLGGQVCTFASILPLSADNSDNTETCTVPYRVTQADIDAYAINGTPLTNTATVRATAPGGATLTDTASDSLTGPAAAVSMTLDKTALQGDFDAVGDRLDFRLTIRNTGNVTWPGPPAITDVLTGGAVCPAGTVAPTRTVVCTASYTIRQADLDRGFVLNEASAAITVAGRTATASDDIRVDAIVTRGLTMIKRLAAGSPNPFTAVGQTLTYEYVLRNTGTVTLSAAAVTDNRVAVTCPATDIAPNATLTCTSDPFTITQPILDAGSVTNVATGQATATGNVTVPAPQQTLTVQGTRNPALSMVKIPPVIDAATFNTRPLVTYFFDVTNDGNVTIPGLISISDDKITNPITCPAGNLAVGQTIRCSGTYQITVQDVADGLVRNEAFATGTDGTQSAPDTAVIPQDGTFDYTLDKELIDPTQTFSQVGDTVDFRITVVNTGDVTFNRNPPRRDDIDIFDPDTTVINGTSCVEPGTIFTQASGLTPFSYFCDVRHTITQADIDAGFYTNSVRTEGTFNNFTDIQNLTDTATVPGDITPSFTIDKAATGAFQNVGDAVPFTFTVTNTGPQTLSSVRLSDPLISAIDCGSGTNGLTNAIPPLRDAPANVVTCTGQYIVDQDDLDAGQVDNEVTAVATTTTGVTLTETDTATALIDPAFATRSLTLTKTPSSATFTAVGETITYTLAVENTGNLTLRDVVVTDDDLGYSCSIAAIAPRTTDSTTCQVTRDTTQEDFDTGSYVNTATATAPGVTPGPTTTADATITATGPDRVASFVFDKTATTSFSAVGDLVDFTLSVRNTGGVTLTNIVLRDDFFDPDLVCTIGSLAPGASDASCVGTHTVTQADIDAGSIENNATLSGNGLDGAPISGADTVVVPGPAERPALVVTKTETDGSGGFGNLPTTETYTFSVRNTGNVTLTGLSITDPLTGFSCPLADIAPGAAPVTTCRNGDPLRTTYSVGQNDIDQGEIENTVTVTGETTRTVPTPVSTSTMLALPGPDQLPVIDLAKTITGGDDFDSVGDTLSYAYRVTNTGNVTLTAAITVADDRTTVSCPALPAGGLAPTQSLTCTATYRVTQADLNAGSVVNLATARIAQRVVPSATYPSGVATITSPERSAQADAVQSPALTIEKRIRPGTPSTFDGPGNLLQAGNPNNLVFEFLVRNTGNVTTTDPIIVRDPLISAAPLTCTTAPVAPGGLVTCSLRWAPTQADVDRGRFDNTATVSTQFNGVTVFGDAPATATALAVQRPDLSILKELVSLDAFSPGEIATYRYTLTNDGNTTITAPITVTDNRIPGPIACGTGNLAPGASTSCTADYTIRARDLDFGSVTNTATGTNGTITSDPTSLTIPPGAEPTLTVTKSPDVAAFTAAGDVIGYTFTVRNTSEGTSPPAFIEPVTILDDRITTPITCETVNAANPLNPGETITCTGSYTVTQRDVDAVRSGSPGGFVTNNAFARSVFAGETVESPVVQATVEANATPALDVTKTAANLTDPGQPADAGDRLQFTIVARNSGTITLNGVTISDPLLGALTCDAAAPVRLAPPSGGTPGGALTCTGIYTVTQADVNAGAAIANTATGEATTPQGRPVTDTGSTDYAVASPAPAMTVVKSLIEVNPLAPYTTAGETISFRVTVTNTGNITLNDVAVTDSLVPGTCTIGTLEPGIDDTSCVFDYVVQQRDIDTQQIENTATGTAQPANPGAAPLRETGVETLVGPDRDPGIGLSKEGAGEVTASDGSATFNVVGQRLTYTYTVANLGNVTLTRLPAITDNRIASVTCDPLPQGRLLPGETVTCRGTDTVTLADINAGRVDNTATATMTNEYGGPDLTATAEETILATRVPDISVSKVASPSVDAGVGDEITYTYTVQNSGNVTLTDITLVDFHTSAAGTLQLAIDNGGVIASLDPGAEATLTARYTVTQADIDGARALTDTVRVTTIAPPGVAGPTDSARARVELEPQMPQMEAIKTLPVPPAELVSGAELVFRLVLTNAGNVTLTEPALTDEVRRDGSPDVVGTPAATLISGDDGVAGVFEVGEVRTYELRYTLTQDDVDAGGITNTVLVTADDPFGTPVTETSDNGTGDGDDPTVVAIPLAPAMEAIKTIRTAPAAPAPGQTVVFEIAVTNTGNVTLTAPSLVEDLRRADLELISPQPVPAFEGGDADADGRFDLGERWVWTVSHVLTQADIDAGGLSNAVAAVATAPDGSPVADVSDNGTGDGDDRTPYNVASGPSLVVVKTASAPPEDPAPGDVITFEITVTNNGNVTLSAPVLADTLTVAGDATVALTPTFTGGDTDTDGAFDVNEQWRYTAPYAITQADIDAGTLSNTVTATATDPSSAETSDVSDNGTGDGDDPTLVTLARTGALNVIKVVSEAPLPPVPGTEVVYSIRVANVGNVSLAAPTLADTITRADGSAIDTDAVPVLRSGDGGTAGTLDVGETWLYEFRYPITQDDIDAGGLINTATATATAPDGTTVTDISDDGVGTGTGTDSGSDPTPLDFARAPAIEATKTVVTAGEEAGDRVRFLIEVQNIGNVTVSEVAIASDTLTRADDTPLALTSGPTFLNNDGGSVAGTLEVGETARFEAIYVLTQDDVDAGGVRNTATASALPPEGAPVTDVTDNGDDTDGNITDDATVVAIDVAPALSLVKSLTSGGPVVRNAGDVLEFAFTVTNSGNVTIAGPFSVSDPKVEAGGGSVICPAGDLDPGAALTCTAQYTVTQADIDAGAVTNVATATADGVTSEPSSVEVLAQQEPDMSLLKQAVSITVDGTTFPGNSIANFRVGAVVAYDYTVTNTGNTTITDPILVTDNLIPTVTCPALPDGGLAPAGALVCEATYTITSDDVILTSVTNLAVATDRTIGSGIASETVPEEGTPSLLIVKELISSTNADGSDNDGQSFDEPGDVLGYRFTVTNIGQTSFARPVEVIDTLLLTPVSCFTPTTEDPDLFPGEAVTCDSTYTVTQQDVDAGEVENMAFAQTTFGAGRIVVSDPDTVVTPVAPNPEVTLVKTADVAAITAPGQVVTYTLTATNTGNQTLRQIVVTDPLIAGLSCRAVTLDPGAARTCTGTYTVTQADIDAGELVNAAAVRAITPAGTRTDGAASLVLPGPAPAPALALVKTATPTPFGVEGSVLRYTLAVENTGNVTLTNVTITDPLVTPAFTCTIPVLAAGASTDECGFGYTVTQGDVDAGEITNTAAATATDPNGTTVTVETTLVSAGRAALPEIEAIKTFERVIDTDEGEEDAGPVAGSVLAYTLNLTNTGNVTVSDVTLVDTMTRADGTEIALDAPFVLVSGDVGNDGLLGLEEVWVYTARYTLTQDDIDAGGVRNSVTAEGLGPDGATVRDVSADGDGADGNTDDDPTELLIDATPGIEAVKSIVTPGEAVGDEVVFAIEVTNTGNVALDDPSVTDTLLRADGTDISADVTAPELVQAGVEEGRILPDETITFEVRYSIVQADIDAGGIANSAEATGLDPAGEPVTDISDSADPEDGDGDADPTVLAIEQLPAAEVVKTAEDPIRVGGTLYDIRFTIASENTGNVTLTDLSLVDDLAAFADPARVVSVTGLTATGFDEGGIRDRFNGRGRTELLARGTTLAPGSTGSVSFTVRLDIADGAPTRDNEATLTSPILDEAVTASSPIGLLAPPEITVTKTVAPQDAIIGQTVTYTITMINEGEFNETGLGLVDEMPAGLVYTPGSARVGGAETPQPSVQGRRLVFDDLAVGPLDSLVVTVQARVTEGPGEFTNRAWALGPDGTVISDIATATLRVRPEAVFDCGDVIGRVFDDRNMNGYQDGPGGERIAEITDQAYDAEKFDTPEAILPPGSEPGLPGVRLATVDGTIITTDEFGRYSVPCAALPADIGSNFTLKIDETSLPTGYFITTENPRTLRLTPGTVTRMNFGAAIANVIDIDLLAAAFVAGSTDPTAALRDGIVGLVGQIRAVPSVLNLTYYRNGESYETARARLDAVEELVRAAWAGAGAGYTLIIERTITEVQ